MVDSLGDRMKQFENISQHKLIPKLPVIMRLDGNCFHRFTHELDTPFDSDLVSCFQSTAFGLLNKIQGATFAYLQSDEISILITDWLRYNSQGFFDYKVQKICSVGASYCTGIFNNWSYEVFNFNQTAYFDCRVFNLPIHEVVNYFVWRQQDATRNSIQSLARANFSHNECHNLSCNELQEKLFTERNINWNDLPVHLKRGSTIKDKNLDLHPPIFSQDRKYIENSMPTLFAREM